MTDFRALCAELVSSWDNAVGDPDFCDVAEIMERARAALTPPEGAIAMTNQHPITPPPELVLQWLNESVDEGDISGTHLANRAAQWGADMELEACCEQIDEWGWEGWSEKLLITRRSNPPSLKERALQVLEDANLDSAHYNIILRALEQLDD